MEQEKGSEDAARRSLTRKVRTALPLIILTALAGLFLGLFVWEQRSNSSLKRSNWNLKVR